MDIILQQIRDFANRAHGSQMRKYAPEKYIVHPVRVMETCSRYTGRIEILAAALLHDVLEDTPVTVDELRTFLLTLMNDSLTAATIKLVVELTDVYTKAAYPKLNRRARKQKELKRIIATSGDSQTIKYADIIDNTTDIAANDPDFAKVFLYECRANLRIMNKGNPDLYLQAIETVNRHIEQLPK